MTNFYLPCPLPPLNIRRERVRFGRDVAQTQVYVT